MSEQSSPQFSSFVDSVRGIDPAWRESVDEDSLIALKDAERREAESLLIERLEGDDWRIPPALSAMKSRRAIPALKQRLSTAQGKMRLAIARALVDLGGMERIDETVAEVLHEGEYTGGLAALTAAEDLAPSEPLVKAVQWASLHHPEPAVRSSAGAMLLYLAGIADEPTAWDHRALYSNLSEQDEKKRELSYKTICALAGRDPDAVM
jgi:HEAT repeat protein